MQNSILNITQHEQGTNSVEALAFYEAIVSHLNPPGSEKFPCGDSKDLKVSTRSKWASGASVGSAVYKDRECGRNLHGQHILHILGPLPGSTLLQARYPGFAGPVWKKHFCGELFWGAFDGKDLVEILRLSFIPQRQRTVERVERALHTVVVEPGTVSPARPKQFFIQPFVPQVVDRGRFRSGHVWEVWHAHSKKSNTLSYSHTLCFLCFSQKHLRCLGSCLVYFAAGGARRKRRYHERKGNRGK